MRRMRPVVIITLLSLLTALLPACASQQEAASAAFTEEEAPAEIKATIRLAQTFTGHVFNAIAEQQGYLADEGIAVEYVPLATDADVFAALENGTVDVASTQGTNLPLQYISEGLDLTIFGGYLLTGCMPVFTRVETEWNSIEDLIGKTMACEPNLYAITGPLLRLGYDPLHDIRWVDYPDQQGRIDAVLNGEADFGLVGTFLNYAVVSNPELKIVTYASDILPNYSCCRIEGRTEWVNENPETVKALLKAWIRAMAYYDNHHEETVALITEITGEDEAVIRAFMDNPRCEYNIDPMKSSVRRAWDYMDNLGLLDADARKININDHINVELYEQALDECQAQYGSENPKFYEMLQAQFARNDQ